MPAIASISATTSTTPSGPHHPLQGQLQTDVSPAVGNTPPPPSLGSVSLSNFLPGYNANTPNTRPLPTFSPPLAENLVASASEDLNTFRDVSIDFFDENDDLFGSPMAFDASENGLWNGRFVPPPPRPPFLRGETVLSDGVTTCDLCSWAKPTKSTFIFEGTIEKASELGWPLTLIIVSILSALLGAIIMITVVRCRRKKANNRNATHVQWWSRNKRSNNTNNNNHLRRSNIYTAHPADSIRGLQQPTLSAASSLTAMAAMGGVGAPTAPPLLGAGTSHELQSFYHSHAHLHHQHLQPQQQHYHHRQRLQHEFEYENEYHQPHEIQLHYRHQRQHSSSMSSAISSPSLTAATIMPVHLQLHQPPQHSHHERDDACRWPNATMIVAS